MQGIWNQMVRWVFWLAVEWPMKIARMAYRGSEGTAKVAVKGGAGRAGYAGHRRRRAGCSHVQAGAEKTARITRLSSMPSRGT
jgi:hypothetical protein